MVGKQSPGKALRAVFGEDYAKSISKVNAISFVFKNIAAFNSAGDDVVQRSRRIYA